MSKDRPKNPTPPAPPTPPEPRNVISDESGKGKPKA
jgi:hypothetical protein